MSTFYSLEPVNATAFGSEKGSLQMCLSEDFEVRRSSWNIQVGLKYHPIYPCKKEQSEIGPPDEEEATGRPRPD